MRDPLYISNLKIAGIAHNIVVVATEHDSVYALDADDPSCHVYWQTSFLSATATTLPAADTQCSAFNTEIGITSTPVIDSVNGVIYVLTNTKEGVNVIQRLHALSIVNGSEAAPPTTIQATVTNAAGTIITFDAASHLQRAALALSNGGIFVAWASYCDRPNYWGWLMRYDAHTMQQTAVFNVAPNGSEGSIWMSGGAPAVDATGNVYVSTGNGSFSDSNSILPAVAPNDNFGQTFLKLDPKTLIATDFFTPSNEATWSAEDEDISSSGVTVIPDGMGPDFASQYVGWLGQARAHVADRPLKHATLSQYDRPGRPVPSTPLLCSLECLLFCDPDILERKHFCKHHRRAGNGIDPAWRPCSIRLQPGG